MSDIQAKIYTGYAKAAKKLGLVYSIYRPSSDNAPLDGANFIDNTYACFTIHGSNDFNFGKPSDYKSPLFHALIDGAKISPGYYITRDDATFFIATMPRLTPILAVLCNRVVAVSRKKPDEGLGFQPTFNATDPAKDTVLAVDWPVSLLKGARGIREQESQNTVGEGAFEMILPPSFTIALFPGDTVNDDMQNKFVVQGAEYTDNGVRCSLQQMTV